jgi:Zn-dependent peptidase ImmA (M78 family)/transcriptional regulator with XRE-family HTH domain
MVSEPTFLPSRLRLARELAGWNQLELARRAGLTPAALSQFESGGARPTAATRKLLGDLLTVPTGFFELPLLDTHDGFFRSLRRTSLADRRRARAIAHIAHDLVTCGNAADRVPQPTVPHSPTGEIPIDLDHVERIAADVRVGWRIPRGPIPDMVGLLESHGVLVIRLPLASADVDAFSLPFSDRPIVVLGADKNDRARSRFDAAHELGHLVMHGEDLWGLPEVERQAHRFAAAFLMPKHDIAVQLPRHPDWPRFFALKRQWQVSLAALLMRGRVLGCMSEGDYLTAIKAASARGWKRIEPVPLGRPEQPKLLQAVLLTASVSDCRDRLPKGVVNALQMAVAP